MQRSVLDPPNVEPLVDNDAMPSVQNQTPSLYIRYQLANDSTQLVMNKWFSGIIWN